MLVEKFVREAPTTYARLRDDGHLLRAAGRRQGVRPAYPLIEPFCDLRGAAREAEGPAQIREDEPRLAVDEHAAILAGDKLSGVYGDYSPVKL